MTLEQCTKKELIEIIHHILCRSYLHESRIKSEISLALSDIELKRKLTVLDEAEKWSKIAHDKRMEYCEVLKPYDGAKLIDIPSKVIYKADRLMKEAQYADKKWDECMRKANT